MASEESDLVRLPGTSSLLPNAELLAMCLFCALRSIVLLYWSIHVLCHLAWWATIVASTPCTLLKSIDQLELLCHDCSSDNASLMACGAAAAAAAVIHHQLNGHQNTTM